MIYGNEHPLTSLLSDKEINELTISKYEEYYHQFYRPNNSFLLIIGPVREEKAVMISQKHFEQLKMKDIPFSDNKLNKIEETKIIYFDTLANTQNELNMIFPFALHPFTFDYEKSELLSILL